MKFLVTGASGFIGAALCEYLQSTGAELVPLLRRGDPAVDFCTANVAPELLRGVDAVFHCAGIAHQRAEASDYEQVNYRAVLELARRCNAAGISSFVFLSSVKAGCASDPYSYWKGRAEQDLRTEFSGQEMAVVIVRPALVYGVGVKGNLLSLIRAVRRGLPVPPGGGERSLIGLPDLCEVLEKLAQQTTPGVQVFEATDGESYNLLRMYAAVRTALGKPPGRPWLPLPLWQLAAWTLDIVRRKSSADRTYDKLFGNALYSNHALREALNWQPRQRLEDLVGDIVAGVD